MDTLKFKTNINCSGCVATVTPFLNETAGEDHWKVDTETTDKVLTVKAEHVSAKDIVDTLKKTGYTAESTS